MAFQTGTGVNDELDGTESKSSVKFTVPNQDIARGIKMTKEQHAKLTSPYEMQCEVVQSLAKWKRIMLTRLGCDVGEGIYCGECFGLWSFLFLTFILVEWNAKSPFQIPLVFAKDTRAM